MLSHERYQPALDKLIDVDIWQQCHGPPFGWRALFAPASVIPAVFCGLCRSCSVTQKSRAPIATVTRWRAIQILCQRSHVISYSKWFSLYPWMTDRHDEHLIANTPGMLAIHEVGEFRGRASPELSGTAR